MNRNPIYLFDHLLLTARSKRILLSLLLKRLLSGSATIQVYVERKNMSFPTDMRILYLLMDDFKKGMQLLFEGLVYFVSVHKVSRPAD